jgi:hypothetical protein
MSIQLHSKESSGVQDEASYGAMPRDYRHAFRAAVGTLEMRDLQVCESAKAAAVDDPSVRLALYCPKTVFHPPTFEFVCFSD